MKSILLMATTFFALALSVCGYADSSDAPPALGQVTGDWLRLQAGGTQASTNAQEASPAMQERAVKRFLSSFDHGIPEFFYNRNSFSGSGGASGASASSTTSH